MRTVILGAGPAGLTAAETLRRLDPQADVVMLSAEPFPPYSPPAIADSLLRRSDQALFWKGEDVAARLGLDYRPGTRARAVEPARRRVVLESGAAIAYDALLVATGSALHAPIAGVGLAGVHDFKSLTAARALVAGLAGGRVRSAAVVGAGFIGVEVALVLRDLGVDVTLVEMTDQVMPRVLDRETARIVEAAIAARGVRLWRGRHAIELVEGAGGRAEAVALQSGPGLAADVFVAATGVKPHLEPLAGSGVKTAWGVPVDERMRTDVPGVWAAGDVAETLDRLTGERYVHALFPNAVAQGEAAALDILGRDVAYPGAESLYSLKHLGVAVVGAGLARGEETLRWRRGDALRQLFLRDGRVVGFRLAGEIGGAGLYRSLMLRGVDVRRFGSRLAEPGGGMAAQVFAAMGIAAA